VDVVWYNKPMTLAIEHPVAPHPKRWTKAEYNDLIGRGAFQGQRLYLFRGELIEISPQYHPHAYALTELSDILHEIFGTRKGVRVRVQLPFDAPGESMPEPDILVCTNKDHRRQPHPNVAMLVAEISDSSLLIHRDKALEYAAAQVPEYWIVDVNERSVEVYRNPTPDPTAVLGYRYMPPTIVASGGEIELLAKRSKVVVAELFY